MAISLGYKCNVGNVHAYYYLLHVYFQRGTIYIIIQIDCKPTVYISCTPRIAQSILCRLVFCIGQRDVSTRSLDLLSLGAYFHI